MHPALSARSRHNNYPSHTLSGHSRIYLPASLSTDQYSEETTDYELADHLFEVSYPALSPEVAG